LPTFHSGPFSSWYLLIRGHCPLLLFDHQAHFYPLDLLILIGTWRFFFSLVE